VSHIPWWAVSRRFFTRRIRAGYRAIVAAARVLLHLSRPTPCRIWYLGTPPPRLRNVGDHAQAIAVNDWLAREINGKTLELDKDEARYMRPILKRVVGRGDTVLIHSGGNLGDRGVWSENLRRQIVRDFPDNRILSLPQTIYFSPTQRGAQEAEESARIYEAHTHLVVLARDESSLAIGSELFPRSCGLSYPDFVLSMPPTCTQTERRGGLLCARVDDESVVDDAMWSKVISTSTIAAWRRLDTTIQERINRRDRRQVVDRMLGAFTEAEVVVTDRFHGMIFSFLTGTPCVAVPTVDHKIASGIGWFPPDSLIVLAPSVSDIPEYVSTLLERSRGTSSPCPNRQAAFAEHFADLARRFRCWDFE
jgi:pyruvyl transferase EpsI